MHHVKTSSSNAPLVLANPPPAALLTVYFDGACPVCRREIAVYQQQLGAHACQWIDAAHCPADALGPGLDRATALQRFHVRLADGRVVQGAAGFAALWSAMPGWRWLGRLAQTWPLRPALALGYAVFLRLRPLWRRAAAAPQPGALSPTLMADLRSDHAGEVGAVCIYRAVLAVSRNADVRAFAQRHLLTEARHQRLIEVWLPAPQRSKLLPGWRLAGWLTGALPALLGPRAVYATVAAVEVFVDAHYAQQLRRIDAEPAHALLPLLRRELAECQADERAHRDEALARHGAQPVPAWLRAWTGLVGRGSAAAVALARRW